MVYDRSTRSNCKNKHYSTTAPTDIHDLSMTFKDKYPPTISHSVIIFSSFILTLCTTSTLITLTWLKFHKTTLTLQFFDFLTISKSLRHQLTLSNFCYCIIFCGKCTCAKGPQVKYTVFKARQVLQVGISQTICTMHIQVKSSQGI